jgi:flagellar biosynthesis protein FlhG
MASSKEVATMDRQLQARPRIWAVGGGKGGVGKTGVASSIAVALARSGFQCVAVDADFGAANLHIVLGVPEPRWSLRQFLTGDAPTLEEIASDTPVPGLRLVSGSRAAVDAANLCHPRRQKLLRHLRKLDVDDVVVDLAAGSSFNVTDFFASADLPLAVVTPEPTAIENTYHFIKASWFRSMRPAVQRPEVREAMRLALGRGGGTLSPQFLIEAVGEVDPSAATVLRRSAEAFRPGLVVNRATSAAEREIGEHIAEGCRRSLGVRVRAVGGLQLDRAVVRSVESRRPVMESFPDSTFAKNIYTMMEQMLLPDSDQIEQSASERRGGIRRALGLDRGWVEKHRQIRHLADLAGAD